MYATASSWRKSVDYLRLVQLVLVLRPHCSRLSERNRMFGSKCLDVLSDSPPTVCSPSQCASCSVASVQRSSQAARRAASVRPAAAAPLREDEEEEDQQEEQEEAGAPGRCLDLSGSVPMPADAATDSRQGSEAPAAPLRQDESGTGEFELRSRENPQLIRQGRAGYACQLLYQQRLILYHK